jgi:signal transduction histidine kinase
LGADLTSIALLDRDGEYLSIAAAAGFDAALLDGERWAVDDALVSAVLSSNQPYVLDKPEELQGFFPERLLEQEMVSAISSAVSVPLLLGDKPLGVLDAAFKRPQGFNEEDLAFLHALGQEAALAIRNARLYEAEREQVARLRHLDELQEAFVSSVSHELRTPLTCVRTSVDLLGATSRGLSAEQDELVRTIEHHTSRLESLVTDLLEITKLEAGQIILTKQPTDLRQIASRVVDALRPLTDRKDQSVRLHLPDSVSTVEVDRRRIEQVLTNILSNAIKFTPKQGHIEIQVTAVAEGLQVCIADDGPGIAEPDQARIFDRFFVVTDGRGLSGVGLGLYIARQMIELHGGRIWVKSRAGEGSTFCFSVPSAVREGQQ